MTNCSITGANGSGVNLAARLCNEARSGQILVDGKVHMAVEALTNTEPLGELALKGMQRPVSVFNILAMRDLRARAS